MRRARRASTSSGTLLARTMSPSTRPAMSRTVERSGSSRPTPTISTKPCFHASSSAPRSTSSRNSIEVCRPSTSASSRTIANGGASLSAAERASRGGASSAASNPGKYSPSTPVRRSARAPGTAAGDVPQRGDGVEHAFAGDRTHGVRRAQHPRDRGDRDAGPIGHVVHGRRLAHADAPPDRAARAAW